MGGACLMSMLMSGGSLHEMAQELFNSSKETGFALMKANYVQRDAWEMPDGKIRGLTREVLAIAVALRDSIWSRFDSLRYHHWLLTQVAVEARRAGRADNEVAHQVCWSAAWHSHYLFDDIIFNAASLFDYVGNAIWFGFHGPNHIKKKWSKAYEAAARPDLEKSLPRGVRIFGSRTGKSVLVAHRRLVNALYEYRSELIHNRSDGPDVYSFEYWERSWEKGFQMPVPTKFRKKLGSLLGAAAQGEDFDMLQFAEALIRRCGEVVIELLENLRSDLGYDPDEPLTLLS